MAGPLATIERFFERLFERPAARLMRGQVEPAHIQRELLRAMENERTLRRRQAHVPSSYRVRLNPVDLAALEAGPDSVSRDLARALHEHARQRRYTLATRPQVRLEGSASVAAGQVVVLPSESDAQPPAVPPGEAPRPAPPATAADSTSAYRAPQREAPSASMSIRVAGRPIVRRVVDGGRLSIGRALDNDVVLADERVSRHHGRIGLRMGMLVYTDLGSTNGSYLNGTPVTEIALGPGDVLQLGSSTLTIDQSA
jgi:hypothetical protein